MMRLLLLVTLMVGFVATSSAEGMSLIEAEDSLQHLLSDLRKADEQADRETISTQFKGLLKQTLAQKGAYKYKFDDLKSMMGVLDSPDGKFRLFNWNVANTDFTHQYFCYVMYYNKKEKEYQVDELKNRAEMPDDIENKTLFQTHWYGALYHDIVPVKKGGRMYYTLLGWKGCDRLNTQRVIEVMYFQSQQIKLGAPIFYMKNKMKRRVVFQHASDGEMSLRYHKSEDEIIFNHLGTTSGLTTGIPEFTVTDLSFDAFHWKKNKWVYVENVVVDGERRRTDRDYVEPEGNPFDERR